MVVEFSLENTERGGVHMCMTVDPHELLRSEGLYVVVAQLLEASSIAGVAAGAGTRWTTSVGVDGVDMPGADLATQVRGMFEVVRAKVYGPRLTVHNGGQA